MQNELLCPQCKSENIYQDGNLWQCPECSHEWTTFAPKGVGDSDAIEDHRVRDAFGNILADGDSVTVIKELRIKGSSAAVKVGTKVKTIRLVDGNDGHNISCKIDGLGAMNLKSEFVKKSL